MKCNSGINVPSRSEYTDQRLNTSDNKKNFRGSTVDKMEPTTSTQGSVHAPAETVEGGDNTKEYQQLEARRLESPLVIPANRFIHRQPSVPESSEHSRACPEEITGERSHSARTTGIKRKSDPLGQEKRVKLGDMPEPDACMRLWPVVPASPECSYSSESSMSSKKTAAITTLRKKAKPDLLLAISDSPIAVKRERLKTPQLSQVSQEIRLSLQGQSAITSVRIDLLDLRSDLYQFQKPAGDGHRLVRIMSVREGSNAVPRYVIKITNASCIDLMERYHDDLTLVMFQQAWTDYVACKCFEKKVEDRFPGQVIIPKTTIVCMSYQDLTAIYGEALSNDSRYQFISKHKDIADELCVFAIIQAYIEMTSFSETDKVKNKKIIAFFEDQIKDSGNGKLIGESANLKLDVKTQKPVFFDLEFDQILDFNILHEYSVRRHNINRDELLEWPLFSEAFDPMPGLTYKKIGFPGKSSLRSSFDRISLSESTTDVEFMPLSDVESGSDSEVFDHKVSA